MLVQTLFVFRANVSSAASASSSVLWATCPSREGLRGLTCPEKGRLLCSLPLPQSPGASIQRARPMSVD